MNIFKKISTKIKESKLEKERLEKERLEKERLEKERLEKERLEKERLEKERLEKERLEKERLKKERIKKERLEKERLEKERLEKERIKKERIKKERIEEKVEKLNKFLSLMSEKERLEEERLERLDENERLRYLIDSICNIFESNLSINQILDYGAPTYMHEYVCEDKRPGSRYDLIAVNLGYNRCTNLPNGKIIKVWDKYDNYMSYGYDNYEFVCGNGQGFTSMDNIAYYTEISNCVLKQLKEIF